MELFETNLKGLRNLWQTPKERQSLQMIVYKAVATSTDLPARDVEDVLAEIGRLLEVEEEDKPRQDPAM